MKPLWHDPTAELPVRRRAGSPPRAVDEDGRGSVLPRRRGRRSPSPAGRSVADRTGGPARRPGRGRGPARRPVEPPARPSSRSVPQGAAGARARRTAARAALVRRRALRLEPLAPAHAEAMFAPMSAPEIYRYTPGAPPASVAALRERYATLARGHSADGRERWLNWVVRLPVGAVRRVRAGDAPPGAHRRLRVRARPGALGQGRRLRRLRGGAVVARARGRRAGALRDGRSGERAFAAPARAPSASSRYAPALHPHGDTEPGDRVFSRACSTSRTTRASSPPSSSSS